MLIPRAKLGAPTPSINRPGTELGPDFQKEMRHKLRTNNLVRTRGKPRARGAPPKQSGSRVETQHPKPDGQVTKKRSGGAAQEKEGGRDKIKTPGDGTTPAHKVSGGDDEPQKPAGNPPRQPFVLKPIVWESDLPSPTANRFLHDTAQPPVVSTPNPYRDPGNVSAWLEAGLGPVDLGPEPKTQM